MIGNSAEFDTLLELVEYFKEAPVTPRSDDYLSNAVPFDHDLGLTIGSEDHDVRNKFSLSLPSRFLDFGLFIILTRAFIFIDHCTPKSTQDDEGRTR